jgi:transposase-like protein
MATPPNNICISDEHKGIEAAFYKVLSPLFHRKLCIWHKMYKNIQPILKKSEMNINDTVFARSIFQTMICCKSIKIFEVYFEDVKQTRGLRPIFIT